MIFVKKPINAINLPISTLSRNNCLFFDSCPFCEFNIFPSYGIFRFQTFCLCSQGTSNDFKSIRICQVR